MNNKLNQYLYFGTQFLRGESVLSAYRKLERCSTLGLKNLEELQAKKLLNLLKYSIENSTFYKKYYNDYISEIEQLRVKDVFKLFDELPVLTKRQAIEFHEEIATRNWIPTHTNISSGTTGEPFEFPCDMISWAYRHASIVRFLSIHGVSFGEKYGYFMGQHWRSELVLKTRIKDRFFNRVRLSAFNINEDSVLETYNWLKNEGATYIHGYPSAIFDFVKIAAELLGLDLGSLKLKLIMTTGESLSENQREYIQENFKAPVRDYYGSVEGGAGAFEGKEGYMHENMETTYIQIEDRQILKTDLFLRKFPLIKFQTGDYVEPLSEVPRTELAHKVIGKIEGRVGEKIKLPNGEEVHSTILSFFIDLFAKSRQIRKFRFVFGRRNILILIETIDSRDKVDERIEKDILQEARKIFNGNTFEIKYIDALPTLINGKHRDWVYAVD